MLWGPCTALLGDHLQCVGVGGGVKPQLQGTGTSPRGCPGDPRERQAGCIHTDRARSKPRPRVLTTSQRGGGLRVTLAAGQTETEAERPRQGPQLVLQPTRQNRGWHRGLLILLHTLALLVLTSQAGNGWGGTGSESPRITGVPSRRTSPRQCPPDEAPRGSAGQLQVWREEIPTHLQRKRPGVLNLRFRRSPRGYFFLKRLSFEFCMDLKVS